MTLTFAKKEAERRTRELGTDHYVIESHDIPGEYMVRCSVPEGYIAEFSYKRLTQ